MWCILLQMLSGVLASPIDKLITNAAEDSESNSFKLHVYLHITSHVFVVVVVDGGGGGGGGDSGSGGGGGGREEGWWCYTNL